MSYCIEIECEKEPRTRVRTTPAPAPRLETRHVESVQTRHRRSTRIDCITVFAEVLNAMPELQQSRQHLIDVFKHITNRQMGVLRQEDQPAVLQLEHRSNRENEPVAGAAKDWTWNLFVYGRDPEMIEWIICSTLSETIACAKEIAIITINGQQTRELSSKDFRALLTDEYIKLDCPDRMVILLEEFTSSMFFAFHRSGFVEENIKRGKQISIICWSSTYLDGGDVTILWKFTNRVFIPSQKDQFHGAAEERNVNRSSMMVHKPNAEASVTEEEQEAEVNDVAPERVNRSPEMYGVQYTQVGFQSRGANNPTRGSATETAWVGANTASNADSVCYRNFQPVIREPQPTGRVMTGGTPKQEEKRTFSAVFWNKNSDSVQVDANGCKTPGEKNKEQKTSDGEDDDTFQGLCERIAAFLLVTYANICD